MQVANHITMQVPATKAADGLVGEIAVGDTRIELGDEPADAARGPQRFAAVWTKGASSGAASVEIRPTSKVTTEITVALARPAGARGLLWTKRSLYRQAGLLAQALRYDIETRTVEKADAFAVRRTSPQLVKARAAYAM